MSPVLRDHRAGKKNFSCDRVHAGQARVEELLREQAQAAAAAPVDAAQQLRIANLQTDLSEARSALAQVTGQCPSLPPHCCSALSSVTVSPGCKHTEAYHTTLAMLSAIRLGHTAGSVSLVTRRDAVTEQEDAVTCQEHLSTVQLRR